jgi:hypothetical protein
MASSSNASPYGAIYLKNFQTTPNPDIVNWLYRPVVAVDTNSGSTYITPANQNSSVYVDQDIHAAGNIFNLSDISKKENIEDIQEDFVNKVFEEIRPRTYQFKDKKISHSEEVLVNENVEEKNVEKEKKPVHYGFIAQEVELVLPELVSYTADTDENGVPLKCVNYVEFIPLLLKKIQVMQKEIEELREKVEKVELIDSVRIGTRFSCFPC